MARWLQRRMVFMLEHDEHTINQGLNSFVNSFDEEQEKWLETWVARNGGTIEFGKPITDNAAENVDDSDDDSGVVKEYIMDWEIGPSSKDMPSESDDDESIDSIVDDEQSI